MILSDRGIAVRLYGDKLIEPFVLDKVIARNGMSYGLSSAGYDIRIAEDHSLYGGAFRLGSSMEKFSMPNDLIAIVHDKSSWARRGLCVQNTVIEPGWRGFLTLELSNHGVAPIDIKAGDPIAQIIFHKLDHAVERPYSGKYQDQEAGPQNVRYDKPGAT